MRLNSREQFLRLDVEDPLASIREQFDLPPRLIYLDGNSLGAMPREARRRLSEAMSQWADGLISSWNDAGWAEAPIRVGDKIGRLLGARPSEVVMGDTTSVNLYKTLSAALSLHGGGAILTDEQNFPTDLYIAEAVAKKCGVELRRVPRDQLGEAIRHGVAVVTATHVDYRTGHMLDMRELTKVAHDAGALFVWDLCHSAGAVPLDLNGADVDLAVGCTYKFLNGGPGAPAYTFAARRLHGDLNNPIPGWFGHERPFDFDSGYRPAPDARRFLTGTPAILSVAALEAAIDLWLTIDIALVRSKSLVLADLLIDQVMGRCEGFGLELASPEEPATRGSQVSFRHPNAYGLVRVLAEVGVVGDHRPPDIARFGLTPLYTRYVDMWDAAEKLSEVLRQRTYLAPRFSVRAGVP
jgi:kynureninase